MKYTCPMHPEIVSDGPGKCPKCGMALVPRNGAARQKPLPHDDRGLGPLSWRNYVPLIAIIGLILLTALAGALRETYAGVFPWQIAIAHFMAGFFLVFGGFKLLDLKGFADGYSTYDILARRVRAYAYAYPFIEIFFGLSMVYGVQSPLLLWIEFVVMAFSGLGVLLKLIKREEIQCVCLGTFLKIPLTKVTLVEDFGMAILALVLLYSAILGP
jgi:hypothetical protein